MSRSIKKHQYIKADSESDRIGKIIAHRKLRARERACLHQWGDLEYMDDFYPGINAGGFRYVGVPL